MAYSIDFPGLAITEILVLDTPITPPTMAEWSIVYRVNLAVDAATDVIAIYYTSNNDYLYYSKTAEEFYWKFAGSKVDVSAAPSGVLGIWLDVHLKQNSSGGKYIEVPDLGITSSTYGIEKQCTIDNFGSSNVTWLMAGELESVKYYSDLSETVLVNDWDATLSNHASNTLTDVVAGNNATSTNTVVWIDQDFIIPVSITTQPLPVTVIEGTGWSITSDAVNDDSSQWHKDSVATGVTTDTLSGTGTLAESGDYFNRYTNAAGDIDTDTITVSIVEPFTVITAVSAVRLGEAFMIQTNGIDDLTTIASLTATFGGIALTGMTNVLATEVTFDAPVGMLQLGEDFDVVLILDGNPSPGYGERFDPPLGYSYVTLAGISEYSFLSGSAYTGNAGGDVNNIGAVDQPVHQTYTNEDNELVEMDDMGIITMPNAVANGITTDQTISWFYLEAQEGYDNSNVAVLTLAVPTGPLTRAELDVLIANGDDVTGVDVSEITDFSELFLNNGSFNQDISGWDVSSATDMSSMFSSASVFNQDISGWVTGSVILMNSMFNAANDFNQDIGSWDVSNVTRMNSMFSYCATFNQDIGSWDVSSVAQMNFMFHSVVAFNQDLGRWDVSNVVFMEQMFVTATVFSQNLTYWDVRGVTNYSLFAAATPMTTEQLPYFGQNIAPPPYPYVTLAISASDSDLSVGQTAVMTFTFSESVLGFTSSDVSATNGVISSFTGSGSVYTAVFTPTDSFSGVGVISVVNGSYTDTVSNNGIGDSVNVNINTVISAVPTLVITSSDSDLTYGETATITLTFSEAVTGFDVSDVIATNGTVGAFTGTGSVYTVVFTPAADFTGVGVISVVSGGDYEGDSLNINLATVGSTLYITVTNIPDGTYVTKIYNDDLNVYIGEFSLVFVNSESSVVLGVTSGVNVHYIAPGDNPPTTGFANIGVTE